MLDKKGKRERTGKRIIERNYKKGRERWGKGKEREREREKGKWKEKVRLRGRERQRERNREKMRKNNKEGDIHIQRKMIRKGE